MKSILFILVALLVSMCAKKNPTGPVVDSSDVNYGDTVAVGIRYQRVADTAADGGSALEITLRLRNTAGRALTLDSTWSSSYINVTRETDQVRVWAWPLNIIQNTAVKKIPLNAGDSTFFRGKWNRRDQQTLEPMPAGKYILNGSILGFRTDNITFEQL